MEPIAEGKIRGCSSIKTSEFKKEIQDIFGPELGKVRTNPEFQVEFLHEFEKFLQNADLNIRIKAASVIKAIFN